MERDLNNNAARAAAHVLLLRILRAETTRLRRSNGTTRLLFLKEIALRNLNLPRRRPTITNLVVSSNFTNEVGKCLIYIDPLLCRCLNELAVEVACKITSLYMINLFINVHQKIRDLPEALWRETYHSCPPASRIQDRTCWRRR